MEQEPLKTKRAVPRATFTVVERLVQASDHTTWHQFFSCAFNYINVAQEPVAVACEEQQSSLGARNCSVPHYGFIDHGMYGAQLAWWLQFFPPEQFLVVSSGQLWDPHERIQVLAPPCPRLSASVR